MLRGENEGFGGTLQSALSLYLGLCTRLVARRGLLGGGNKEMGEVR